MANVTVTVNQANISVDEANSNVAVTTTQSNVVVAELPIISNSIIRASLSVTDTGGDGSLAYDNTTGVFTYTGSSDADKNTWLATRTTDNLTEGSTNLYYTNARADARVNLQTGVNLDLSSKDTDDLSEGSTNLYFTNARANAAFVDSLDNITTNITSTANISGANVIASGNIEGSTLRGTGVTGLVVTGNATIGGNLDVTGNINSETVVDLFVEDRNITMQYGATGTPSADSHIFIDRGDASNTYIRWNEGTDRWQFSNDGSSSNDMLTLVDVQDYIELEGIPNGIGDINTSGTLQGRFLTATDNAEFRENVIVGQANQSNVTLSVQGDITIPNQGNITTANGNITGAYLYGDGSNITGLGEHLTNAEVKTYIEANGLDATANLTTTANVSGTYILGDGSFLTGMGEHLTNAQVLDYLADYTGNLVLGAATGTVSVGKAANTTLLIGGANSSIQIGPNQPFASTPATVYANTSTFRFGGIGSSDPGIFDIASGSNGAITIVNTPFDISSNVDNGGLRILNETPAGSNVAHLIVGEDGSNSSGIGPKQVRTSTVEHKITHIPVNLANSILTSNSNITTTANISADNVLTDVVESATSVTLYGKATGVELDKAIDSTDVSTIVNLDTTGYSLADATTPADFTVGDHTPSLIIKLTTETGNNQAVVGDIYGGALAGLPYGLARVVSALRGPSFSTATNGGSDGAGGYYEATDLIMNAATDPAGANIQAAFETAGTGMDAAFIGVPTLHVGENGLSNVSAGLYGTSKGWSVFNTTTQSGEDVFPLQTYTTGATGNVITFSEDAIATGEVTLLFQPGMAQTSSSNVQLKYYSKNNTGAGGNAEPTGLYGRMSTFDQPETLSNVTFDAISYANVSSVTMSSVNTKNMADFEGTAESAARFPRGLLIGPSTTPDAFSGRTGLNDSSALGVILENDGETYTGNNAPAAKFLINSYSGNLDDLTYYPNWGTQGATGNITLDLPQLKAPQLQLKSFRGAKSTANASSYLLEAGDVVGKVVFSPGQTTGTGFQGADLFNPPSAITVDVGDADITTVANAYMHLTTTPDPGTNLGYMRNNANVNNGANQQTNFTTKGGNVTIAAQVDGKITLAPTPDYGDAANSTVWTRFAGSTHEYHTYLDAGFKDKSARTGTLVEIQPKSGTTTGTGGLGYDSKGDSTLRLTTHEANSAIKKAWEITNEQASGNLIISDNTTGTPVNVVHFDGVRVQFDEVVKLQNLDTTAINALPSPEAGDMVYNTTLNQVCFYNGTAWQKITSATM